jgi:hypothetical protein
VSREPKLEFLTALSPYHPDPERRRGGGIPSPVHDRNLEVT